MEEFIDYCKDYLLEHIDEYEGQTHYVCDFGFMLTEGPNCDGTLTYSTERAKDYLREWWWEAGEYYEYEKFNFGQNLHNPFENPEAYMVCMVIEGVGALWSRAIDELGMQDQWNDEVELTPDLIAKVKECVEDMYVETLF